MKLIPKFERLNSGENNSRTISVNVESIYADKMVKIGFVTPMGKVYITDEIKLTYGEADYLLPYELLDGKGLLSAQLIICEDEKFIIKSPVYEFPVYASVDDSDCPFVTSEGIKSLALLYEILMNKADAEHRHDDIYFTESEISGLLALKSDITHTHDSRYYTEDETDQLLSEKSDVGHMHDDRYYTESRTDELLSGKSDTGHIHNWYEIENKPGTEGNELAASLVLDDLYKGFGDSSWSQYFDVVRGSLISGEVLRVRIKLAGSEEVYEELCKVLNDSLSGMLCVSFNNSALTEEDAVNGTGSLHPEPVDSSKPSFILFLVADNGCEINCAGNYDGANIEVFRTTFIKLGNEALNVTDKVTEDSEELVTSGGVFDALKGGIDIVPKNLSEFNNDAGYVTKTEVDSELKSKQDVLEFDEVPTERSTASVTSGGVHKAISSHNTDIASHNDVRLLVSELSQRINAVLDSDDTTLDQLSEIVAYIKSNKSLIDAVTTQKISYADIVDNIETNVSNKPLSAAMGVELKSLIDAIVIPTKVSQLTNDADYVDGTAFDKALSERQKPFVITAAGDFQKNILTNVSHTFEEISEAYERGDHIYIDVDINQFIAGQRCLISLVSFLPSQYVGFEQIISADASIHLTAFLFADGSSNIEFTSLATQTQTGGLSFAVSDTVPTVDDRNVITFVVEE